MINSLQKENKVLKFSGFSSNSLFTPIKKTQSVSTLKDETETHSSTSKENSVQLTSSSKLTELEDSMRKRHFCNSTNIQKPTPLHSKKRPEWT